MNNAAPVRALALISVAAQTSFIIALFSDLCANHALPG
jgi:hypothetical protein